MPVFSAHATLGITLQLCWFFSLSCDNTVERLRVTKITATIFNGMLFKKNKWLGKQNSFLS